VKHFAITSKTNRQDIKSTLSWTGGSAIYMVYAGVDAIATSATSVTNSQL
jgi:hypothetical protein